ncbi:MAG: 16S rRNA (cytosine(967)-C(5))-methyltransferase RsmB [Gammaproteobacteria bacterium]|nr:16S rRNA (cytosine(967)-C(5))-methyltransferase RsmB [Gammaproteobacteria bacterium]
MSPADLRAKAAHALAAVRRGRALRDVIEPGAPSLLTELAYGTCRRYFSVRAEVDACLARPLRKSDQDLYALLMVGAYQVRHTGIPPHAAVSETVAATAALRKPWARPLLNAVLRRIARTSPSHATDEARHDHPQWLIDALEAAYPQACPELFEINNSRAPMALRVNRARTDPRRYASKLDAQGLEHRPGIAPGSLILERPIPVRELPGYEPGCVAVQDDGAQLAAALLDPSPGAMVLDACTAPGGKAFHLLERDPSLQVSALDRDEARLGHLKREARRLGHTFHHVMAGDATGSAWWDGEPFDAVLLDVPCSGTGTLRRHPDIKVNRRPDALARMAEQQRALLEGVWPTLSSGGTLLYCTCSILPAENQDVVAGFLQQTPDAKARKIRAKWGFDAGHGRLLLPCRNGADGFFFALIDKASTA